jgi:hypothetical protein
VFDNIVKAAEAKMKELGLKADAGRAVVSQPRHGGRRNPLRGQLMGSGDFNGMALIDWIASITAFDPADLESTDERPVEPAVMEAAKAMKQAHDDLIVVHATAKSRQ